MHDFISSVLSCSFHGATGHGTVGGPIDSIVHSEAAQPISKQEVMGQGSASSCVWSSGDTNKTLLSEPKNLNANKRSQSADLETGDGLPITDPVPFDCMLYEPHSQHGSHSTHTLTDRKSVV